MKTALVLSAFLLVGCDVVTAKKVFVASSVADLGTTAWGLSTGLEEGNPIINTGHKWSTLTVAAVISIASYLAGNELDRRGEKKLALWFFNIGSAARLAAASHNIVLIEQKE